MMATLGQLAADLAAGRTTSATLVTQCLDRITSATGEGGRAFLKVYADTALTTAKYYDDLRRRGAITGGYAGIPISVKDLFDIAGDTTRAGSVALNDAAPATEDANAVARLRQAGFIVIGRTNMTEFAYSGLGLNPHYGTPLSPWDRATGRAPGGSSSGAAVSIADGMAFGALGTDTGGSCRIPAAFCGVVGFKPTARRVSLDGAFPLSTTLDSAGPLANSVECCATLDAVLAGETRINQSKHPSQGPTEVRDLRLGVLASYVVDGIDPTVAAAFDAAVRRLAGAGARLTDLVLTELNELPDINRKGGISAPEAYALHRERLPTDGPRYDPRVLTRILRGREQDAADYIDLLKRRASFIQRVARRVAHFDALLMPTTPIIPPALAELERDEDYGRINALVLRNPSIVNFLDGCAISLPCHDPGSAPVGLTLFSLCNRDRELLSIAGAVESGLLRRDR